MSSCELHNQSEPGEEEKNAMPCLESDPGQLIVGNHFIN